MRAFVALLSLVAAAQASILPYAATPYLGGVAHLGLAPYGLAPYTLAAGAPLVAAGAPLVAAAAPAPVLIPTPSSQFQSQDEFGNLAYGYSNINSAKHEAGNAYGGVSGSYSYVDANGQLQTTNYVADDFGFRVAATNLPVANQAQPENTLVGPEPVTDTEEVAAAKAEFKAAFDEAASRHKRSTGVLPASTLPLAYAAATPAAIPFAPVSAFGYGAGLGPIYAPAYGAGYAAPYGLAPFGGYPYGAGIIPAGAAPAGLEATLTKIQNNPGHALSYRIE